MCKEFAINLLLQSERNVAISLTLNTDQPVSIVNDTARKYAPLNVAKHKTFWMFLLGWSDALFDSLSPFELIYQVSPTILFHFKTRQKHCFNLIDRI